jgi:uncharacterized protein (TIGR03437 family)
MKTARNPLFLTLGVLAGACLVQAQTATPVTCTAATLNGAHSITVTGRNISPTAPLSTVLIAPGTATFDGVSAVTLNLTVNTNQSAGTVQTWTGTYSLPSNCLGTMTIATGDPGATFILIPFNSGKSFTITGQDSTYSFTGTGSPSPATCVTASLTGAYAFTGNGFILSAGTVGGVNAISGLLQFDGAGSITSGSWTITTAGVTASDSVTGKYTITPACVATATLTDNNGVPYTLGLALTTADGANFGMSLATATATFTGNGHSTFTYPGLAVEQAAGVSLATPPGSIFSIYGFNMSNGQAPATAFPLPANLANAKVTVNNESVPLYYVNNTALGAEGLINAIMPYDIQPGVATLVVTNGTTASNAVAINIPSTPVPAIFTYGNAHAEAQNLPSYTLNADATPASVGDTIVVYFTGGGPVANQGQIATNQQVPAAQFGVTSAYSATIAGVAANVTYCGLVPTAIAGFYQADIVIPKVGSGDRVLVLTVGGKASNSVMLSIK